MNFQKKNKKMIYKFKNNYKFKTIKKNKIFNQSKIAKRIIFIHLNKLTHFIQLI